MHLVYCSSNCGDVFSMEWASSSYDLFHWVHKVEKAQATKKWYSVSHDEDESRWPLSVNARPIPAVELSSYRRGCWHQHNEILSGSYAQTPQTLRKPLAVFLSSVRCSKPLLELCHVLSDSAEAFSGAPESTWNYGDSFRMLRDWLLGELNFGVAETTAQVCRRLWEQQRPLCKLCMRLGATFSQQWFLDCSAC